jgi:hypothetical protein
LSHPAIVALQHKGAFSVYPECREFLNRCSQRSKLVMRVDIIQFCAGVPGELLSDFLGHARICECGVEAVPERVER